MKYVSRGACDSRGALGGVLKEVELLSSLEHPFLVNLWFSFQGNNLFHLELKAQRTGIYLRVLCMPCHHFCYGVCMILMPVSVSF